MASVGTIVANLVANTDKFTKGFKKAKDSIHSVQMQMTGLNQVVKQQQDKFVKLGSSVGDALAVEAERAEQRKKIALKTEVVVGQARVKAMQKAERGLAAARFAEIRASEMKALKLRQFYARKQEEVMGGGPMFGRRFIGAGKKAFGALGLGAGLVGDSLGDSSTGRIAGAVGNIAGSAALGGIAAGPFGAVVFGSVTALKEFKAELERTTEIVTKAREFQQRQIDNFIARRQNVREEAAALRERFFPTEFTEDDARKELVDRARQAKELLFLAKERQGGFDAKDEELFRRDWQAILNERIKFDQQRQFRNSGAQGVMALFQSRSQLLSGARQLAANALGQAGAGILGIRGAIFEGQINRRRTEDEMVAARVAQLQSQTQDFARPGLAIKGTQDFLKAIHADGKDEKKDIKELVRIAKLELAAEERSGKELAAEIARQRVTVNMP